MKTSKMNGLSRLLSFLLIAVLLICTVGFAVNGWQSKPNDEPDSGDFGDNTDKTDENTDGTDKNPNNQDGNVETPTPPDSGDEITPPVEIPKFYNTITGLEITEAQAALSPLGFVLNPGAPLYGVSNSDLTIEFPIEDGSTRLLTYTTDSSLLWKIGRKIEDKTK